MAQIQNSGNTEDTEKHRGHGEGNGVFFSVFSAFLCVPAFDSKDKRMARARG